MCNHVHIHVHIDRRERERDDLVDRDFKNVKIVTKQHLNGHMHNKYVPIEQWSRFNQNRDIARDIKVAALRCARH